MSKPKILIFAPRAEPPETVNALEGLVCELVFGDRDWQLPRTTHVGVDDVDTEAATDLGIMVCHAPTESNCFGVAETTITFMLSLLKKSRRARRRCARRQMAHR